MSALTRTATRALAASALVAAILGPAACAHGPPRAAATPPATSTAKSTAEDDAARLFRDAWDLELEDDPVEASRYGDRRWNDRWADASPAGVARKHDHYVSDLARLHAIPRAALSRATQLDYDLFERHYALEEERFRHGLEYFVIDQRDGLQTLVDLPDELRFETPKDYDDWIARLRSFPALVDGTTALLREAIAKRFVQPRVVMERVPPQIDKQIVPADQHPFFAPFRRFPASFPAEERARMTRDARAAIDGAVVPALRRFRDFLVKEYLPACWPEVGAWQYPDGAALYAFAARYHTTTKLTPREIHDLGLREVARIGAEMDAIVRQVGFAGTRKEFFQFLRTDPRFFHTKPDELLAAYRAVAKRIDPTLVKLFKTIPRMPYGVEPIPAEIAPDTYTAYYGHGADDGSRAGTFYVNLYKPETRPTWEMMALAMHEAVPGHHLQIARMMELGAMPEFRKHASWTAFIEGWALYAESLGADVGLYDDPYSRFGQLTYQMWRAVRLVVDTGIHTMRWSRAQAIAYFLEHAAKQELDVTNEVDRYIAWPGQALAYKVGELDFRALRAKAEAALGPALDVRELHDVMLEQGAVPLDVLDAHVDAWIDAKRAAAAAATRPSR